jgi:DNA adenine methylase
VYAFWDAALNETDKLCQLISDVPVTMDEWHKQKCVQEAYDPDPLDLALSTFFLNRTNRSGIISGGVIGGKQQNGIWKLGARFNKLDLIQRIEKIACYRSRIRLYGLDAKEFIAKVVTTLAKRSLTFFDPPYFVKGQQMLYTNYYSPDDHIEIANLIFKLPTPWIISYDDVGEIRALYDLYRCVDYSLSYSAQERYRGRS